MSLSPFRARLALVAFLGASAAVAGNIFALQGPRGEATQAGMRADRARLAMDQARLDRLAFDASGGRESATSPGSPATSEPKRGRTIDARSSPARSSEARSGDGKGAGQRLGSFAPSSGQFSLVALPGADPTEARRATIRAIQTELARRGYEPGVADGAPGLVTRAAVLAYEHDQGLPLTADPSPEVLAHLRHGTSAPGAAIGIEAGATPQTGHAEAVIRSVQQSLGALGYLAVSADGIATDDTVRAIREFEMDAGLVPSGRISGPLIARIARAQGRGKVDPQ